MQVRSTTRRATAVVLAVVVLAAGCSSTDGSPAATPSPSPTGPATLTLAVYGPEPVLEAFTEITDRFTLERPDVEVRVETYPDHDEAMEAYREALTSGDPVPDVFLADQDDLAGLTREDAVRSIDDLLAEREVDFGDGYTRSGLAAFSADAALQCMPLDVSPLVVYYNPQLIELDALAAPGANPVNQEDGWSLEEFAAGARQARARGVRGMHIAPDLEQVAPFVWSGGGEVVDDDTSPTRLTLSDDASVEAMRQLLELVRDPALTFDRAALRKSSALERFKAGKLGMILGFRDLTPRLRENPRLIFDVMPLPKLSSGATIATMSGLCISASSPNADAAADLVTQVISEEGTSRLAKTGYVMPANLDVVNSEAFVQPGKRPLNVSVFPREVRDIRLLPNTEQWPEVRRAANRSLTQLFNQPVILPLQQRLAAIDTAAERLLGPGSGSGDEPAPDATPSPEP